MINSSQAGELARLGRVEGGSPFADCAVADHAGGRERRAGPTMPRSSLSRRRTSPARESDGSAMTMNTGSPSWPVTQVSIVAGAVDFNLAAWVFCTVRVP